MYDCTVVFVEEQDVEVLRKYLTGGNLTLVFPEQQELVERLGVTDDDEVDYGHGGEANMAVDVVSSDCHHFINHLKRVRPE